MKKAICYISVFISLLIAACNNNAKQKRMFRDLTNDKYKYWYRYHYDTSKSYALGFCFYSNGTFIEYSNPNYNKTKRYIFRSPILSKPNWKLIDDTTIMFGGGDYYKIISLNADSIVLQILKSNTHDFLKLHRDNDQFTVPNP